MMCGASYLIVTDTQNVFFLSVTETVIFCFYFLDTRKLDRRCFYCTIFNFEVILQKLQKKIARNFEKKSRKRTVDRNKKNKKILV